MLYDDLVQPGEYICHHGIKGQKWGIRRYQNADGSLTPDGKKRYNINDSLTKGQRKRVNHQIDAIDTYRNRSNRWDDRKIAKLRKKGKTAKAETWEYHKKQTNKTADAKMKRLKNIKDYKDYKSGANRDALDWWFGGQNNSNNADFTNLQKFRTRLNEYNLNRGARWASNFTLEKTLARMTPAERYDYLRRKAQTSRAYATGYNQGLGHSDIEEA